MPHLDIVAYEALCKSETSKSIHIYGDMLITSPFRRQSFLLSSKTVLRFSIQLESTGPSSNINYLLVEGSFVQILNTSPSTPSVHSLVNWSNLPNK